MNEDSPSLEEPAEWALESRGDWDRAGAAGGGCESWSQSFLKRESWCGRMSSILLCSLGLNSESRSEGSPATLLAARRTPAGLSKRGRPFKASLRGRLELGLGRPRRAPEGGGEARQPWSPAPSPAALSCTLAKRGTRGFLTTWGEITLLFKGIERTATPFPVLCPSNALLRKSKEKKRERSQLLPRRHQSQLCCGQDRGLVGSCHIWLAVVVSPSPCVVAWPR